MASQKIFNQGRKLLERLDKRKCSVLIFTIDDYGDGAIHNNLSEKGIERLQDELSKLIEKRIKQKRNMITKIIPNQLKNT